MTPNEHAQTMKELEKDSRRIFSDGGNYLVAAELLWGALAHGLIAIAELNNWRCDGHQGYKAVARQLQAMTSTQRWLSDAAAGEQLHRYFYRGHLNTNEMERCKQATLQGIKRLAEMLEQLQEE